MLCFFDCAATAGFLLFRAITRHKNSSFAPNVKQKRAISGPTSCLTLNVTEWLKICTGKCYVASYWVLPKGDANMGGESRREYLKAIRQRYVEASRDEKGIILQEFCAICDYHRKHAIRLLNQRKREPRKRPGRKPVYHSTELLRALKRIWLATDQMCSKRLVTAIPLWLPFYERLSDEVRAKLLSISAATIDRLLAPIRARTRRGIVNSCGLVS